MLTVVNDDRYGALLSDLREVGFDGLPGDRACKVPARDDNGKVGASIRGLMTELDRFARAAGSGARDDRQLLEPGVIQCSTRGLDKCPSFGVREMVGFAHGAGDEGEHIRLCEPEDVRRERGEVWWCKYVEHAREIRSERR